MYYRNPRCAARSMLLALSTACMAVAAIETQALAAPASQPADTASSKGAPGTIGLVITDWRYGFYLTPNAAECSLGEQKGEPAQARAQAGYVEYLHKYGGSYDNRGPNGELANYNPQMVEDPLPFSELTTTIGYGLNLDGTSDGHSTAKTCKHEKFTDPSGEKVDNQIARVLGCVHGFRIPDNAPSFGSTELINSTVDRRLIEITGVVDERNDPDVEVAIYKGRDVIVRAAEADKFVPFQSQRIDERFPQYTSKTHGRIVDGVLITDPIPSAHIAKGNSTRDVNEYDLKDMTLRLRLTGDGAEGILAGYESIDTFWQTHSKSVVSGLSAFSSASLYKAFYRYADGYPDPATGQCTRISVTYKIKATRAMIVHSAKDHTQSSIRISRALPGR